MNCKPGDLAIVKRSQIGNAGKVVRVLRWEAAGDITPDGSMQMLDGWRCEGSGLAVVRSTPLTGASWLQVVTSRVFSDGNLIPIRDEPGADQTLTWAGKPADAKMPEVA